MSIGQSMLPEFDQEMQATRLLLERVPETLTDWKPHEKSMPLDYLASHVAELAQWAELTLGTEELDVMPEGGEPMRATVHGTRHALLAAFDGIVPKARAAIAAASDEEMMHPWSLKAAGQAIFTLPKAAVLRSFVMNHLIHHRAQLQVYLRLQNIPVPGMYGPSADGEVVV